MKEKVILFGASQLGRSAYYSLESKYQIIGYVDNDKLKWGKEFEALPVYSPDSLSQLLDVQVIITSFYVKEISEQLKIMGIKNYWIYKSVVENSNLKNSSLSIDKLPKVNLGRFIESLNKELTIQNLSFLSGGSSMLDYFFLKALMLNLNLKVYLEIGTWTGESIAAVSEIAEHCYSVSLPDDDEGLINVFSSYCNKNNFSRFFSKYINNITHFETDSATFNYNENINNKVDLVFIDGNHSYEGIYKDTSNIFEFTGYEDTIVVWHDFRTGRNEIVETTVEAILEALPKKYHSNLYSVDNNYCGIYIPEKYKASFSFDEDPNSLTSYEVKIYPKINKLEG
jgi:hypothetical protein